MRISLGHVHDQVPLAFDDDEVVRAALDEVGGHLGIELAPTDLRVVALATVVPAVRAAPPRPRRADRTRRGRRPPGVRLAGAAYRGIGIPACIDQGRRAARALTTSLVGAPE